MDYLTIFCRISLFFFMSLQIFLYQGLAGLRKTKYNDSKLDWNGALQFVIIKWRI